MSRRPQGPEQRVEPGWSFVKCSTNKKAHMRGFWIGRKPAGACGRALLQFLAVVLGLLIASTVQGQAKSPSRSPGQPGAVYLFSGMVWPIFDSTKGTGTEEMMQQIRALGVRAEVDRPDDWEQAANAFIALGQPSMPVAVVGYSLGANAAILFSRRLEQAGIPVQTLVVIEASKPPQIPANVRRAVHYYVSRGADPISPAPGFSGSIANINLAKLDPDAARMNHWSVSHLQFMHSEVVAEIIAGGRVRVRDALSNKTPEARARTPKLRIGGQLDR